MRHLVGQGLHLVGIDAGGVLDDVVRGRVDGPLVDRQRHEEEVVALRFSLQQKHGSKLDQF